MKIGFIGLGNVGGKLAGSLLRNNFDVTVRDIDESLTNSFKKLGAKIAKSPKELAEQSDLIITSLPSPEVSAEVMESKDGILNGLSENKIWLEMSTTDENEVKRLGEKVISKKAVPLDGPVSGGCHRAATGNIAIFVGGERKAFEKILPALTVMGRKVLHTGELGSASVLKVITNYLASVHLVALGEAWTVAKKSNLDLAKAYKGIAVSSGKPSTLKSILFKSSILFTIIEDHALEPYFFCPSLNISTIFGEISKGAFNFFARSSNNPVSFRTRSIVKLIL